jgi:hypothetical protein
VTVATLFLLGTWSRIAAPSARVATSPRSCAAATIGYDGKELYIEIRGASALLDAVSLARRKLKLGFHSNRAGEYSTMAPT